MGNNSNTWCTLETVQDNQSNIIAPSDSGLKKCPFCAEHIQQEAIKCRYCHEFLQGANPAPYQPRSQKKWYFANASTILSLLFFGPLALPLIWANPRYRKVTKSVITFIVLTVTVLCFYAMILAYQRILNQLDVLGM